VADTSGSRWRLVSAAGCPAHLATIRRRCSPTAIAVASAFVPVSRMTRLNTDSDTITHRMSRSSTPAISITAPMRLPAIASSPLVTASGRPVAEPVYHGRSSSAAPSRTKRS
jgi:hypothetical protein